jgi:4-amino-4-deoxy-L-arabinose transferase-like glycosyltransferase
VGTEGRRWNGLLTLRRAFSTETLLLWGIVAVAACTRFYALGSVPPGLYHDEAFNGLDALGVLAGTRPLFFEANNGREPLFIYLIAPSIAFLGRSPLAIRLVSALLGTLTIPAAYLMAEALFERRVGLLTAAVTAIALWPINLSRVGFRAVAMPLFVALTLWQLGRGLKTHRLGHFAAGGLLYGLTFYTYLAARFTLLALAAWIVYLVLARQNLISGREALAFGLAALVITAPLAGYLANHGSVALERSYQVSIFNPDIHGGDPWGTLLRHTGRALLMFTTRGDFIPRHNVPYRPVFDPALAAFFLLGLVISLMRAREPSYGLALIWLGVMLLPTILAEDAPHFLRAVGVLPVAFVFPALGLETTWDLFSRHASALSAALFVGCVLALGLAFTYRDYFVRHARSEVAYYNFETGAVELAEQINDFLASEGERCVYLAPRLWKSWASLRFLVPPSPNLVILGQGAEAPQPPPGAVMLILSPYGENQTALALLPHGATITVQEGAMERGDLETEARLLYVTVLTISGLQAPRNAGANFEDGIALLGYEEDLADRELRLRLFWQASEPVADDYTAFVHVTRDGDGFDTPSATQPKLIAQDDAQPARGYYPTSLWRPGDTVVDEHFLRLPEPFDPAVHQVVVGLYRLETLERLKVLNQDGQVVGDSVVVEVASR